MSNAKARHRRRYRAQPRRKPGQPTLADLRAIVRQLQANSIKPVDGYYVIDLPPPPGHVVWYGPVPL